MVSANVRVRAGFTPFAGLFYLNLRHPGKPDWVVRKEDASEVPAGEAASWVAEALARPDCYEATVEFA